MLGKSNICNILKVRNHRIHERSHDGSYLRRFDVCKCHFRQHEACELDVEKWTKHST